MITSLLQLLLIARGRKPLKKKRFMLKLLPYEHSSTVFQVDVFKQLVS